MAIGMFAGLSDTFPTLADLKAFNATFPIAGQPNGGYPAIGAVASTEGLNYRWDGVSSGVPGLPGWVLITTASSNLVMSGGGTAQDYAGFSTRAAFVTWASGKTPAAGTVIAAEGLFYRYDGVSTSISALPGWIFVDVLQLEHAGAKGDGTTNDRSPFNALGASIVGGRYIEMPNRYLLTSGALVINSRISLKGRLSAWDSTDRAGWMTSKSTVVLDPIYPINMQNGSGMSELVILRQGLNTAAVDVAAVAAYSGTGINLKSAGHALDRMAIFGFQWAVTTDDVNTARLRFHDLNIDCTNGIRLLNDLGGSEFIRVRCEPNLTAGSDAVIRRTGIGLSLGGGALGTVDGPVLTDCFMYQDYGYVFTGMNSVRSVDCMSDGPRTTAEGIGLQVLGDSTEHSYTNFRVASHRGGVYIDTIRSDLTTPCTHYFTNFMAWQNRDYAMTVKQGIVYIGGGAIKRSPSSDHDGVNLGQGLVADGPNAVIYVDGVDFSNLTTALTAINGGTIYYGPRCRFGAFITNFSVTSGGGQVLPLSFAMTGDVTKAVNSNVTTLATVNSNVGTFGDAFSNPAINVNGKGLITAVSSIKKQPARMARAGATLVRFFPSTIFAGTGVLSLPADKLSFWPVPLPEGYSPDTLEWEVTTLGAGNARVGVYLHDPATNGPGALWYDSGLVSVAATGIKTNTLTTPLSGRDMVWVALHMSIATGIRAGASNGIGVFGGVSLAAQTCGFTILTAFAALPADASILTLVPTGDRAQMALYKA